MEKVIANRRFLIFVTYHTMYVSREQWAAYKPGDLLQIEASALVKDTAGESTKFSCLVGDTVEPG